MFAEQMFAIEGLKKAKNAVIFGPQLPDTTDSERIALIYRRNFYRKFSPLKSGQVCRLSLSHLCGKLLRQSYTPSPYFIMLMGKRFLPTSPLL